MAFAFRKLPLLTRACLFDNIVKFQAKNLSTTSQLFGLKDKFRKGTLEEMKRRVDHLKEKGEYKEIPRTEYIEWNYDLELNAVGPRFGESLNTAVLIEAMTDEGYMLEEQKKKEEAGIALEQESTSNSHLTELGLDILKDTSENFLRDQFPKLPQEAIGSIINYITNEENLGQLALNFGFKDLVRAAKPYPAPAPALCKAFCSFFACVASGPDGTSAQTVEDFDPTYLKRAQDLCVDIVLADIRSKDIWEMWEVSDPVRMLEDVLGHELTPRLVGSLGPDSLESIFRVALYDPQKRMVESGFGTSINEAIKVSAMNGLSKQFNFDLSRKPFNIYPKSISL